MTRIAITGIGLVTPLGLDAETTWNSLLQGSTAGRWLELIPSEQRSAWRQFGAPVQLEHAAIEKPLPKSIQFALRAAHEAIDQAQLTDTDLAAAGCVIGTSKADFEAVDRTLSSLRHRVDQDPNLSALFPSTPATEVAHCYRMGGPQLCPVAACATGLVSLIRAANLIRHGTVKSVICGSTDASLHSGLLASYRRLGVLAQPHDDPSAACRPFDRHRTGFLVGEGAGMFVIEDWQSALARGATPLAEWIDGQIGSDPTGITQISESGIGLTQVVRRLLDRNGRRPKDIRAVSYHGTATRMNDLAEANALSRLCGGAHHVPIGFGIKGAIGHLMGAAGAVETAVSVLALQHQQLPPTANFSAPDPDCPISVTNHATEFGNAEYLLKTSLGFGGHLAVGLLKRVKT